jgi:hypothetical protein
MTDRDEILASIREWLADGGIAPLIADDVADLAAIIPASGAA